MLPANTSKCRNRTRRDDLKVVNSTESIKKGGRGLMGCGHSGSGSLAGPRSSCTAGPTRKGGRGRAMRSRLRMRKSREGSHFGVFPSLAGNSLSSSN